MFKRIVCTLAFVASSFAVAAPASADATARTAVTAESPAATRAQLAARRKVQIQRLHEYAAKRSFPRNRVRPTLANVFVDESGRLCAVANLVAQDGHRDIVDRTARANNLVRVADLTEGELIDWVLASGLTREEAILIQKPYMPMTADPGFAAREDARLAAHFAEVEKKLVEDTDASLDLAVARLVARRATK
jgi:hypothetical protein